MIEAPIQDLPKSDTEPAAAPRVLVADDNRGLAELWSFVLSDAGHSVTVADSGATAFAAAAGGPFDLAVLDLQMPDITGLEVFSRLRARNPEMEGVIITGHASVDSAIEAVNRGIYGYLVKPVAPDALRIMADRALEHKRLQCENRRMLSYLTALMQVLDTAMQTVGLDDAFQRISEAVVSAMRVDDVALLLQDAEGCLAVAAAHPMQDEIRSGFRLQPGEGLAGRVFAAMRPIQVADIHNDATVLSPYLLRSDLRSVLGVPILADGKALGVLRLGTKSERTFEEEEVRLLEAIAERLALAVEKARLLEEREEHRRALEVAYRRERHIAETLQRSLLPAVQLNTPGISVDHSYQPALEEAEVGGDFYDIIELGGGLIGILMGDVSGKGLDAAVYTALLKYTLRSYALQDPDPGRVMAQLNPTFALQAGPETFATLFYGVLDTQRGDLAYVNAGHEPPLLRQDALGATAQLRSTGPLAGVIPDAEYETTHVPFQPGDTLFLYTDGASDASRNNRWLGTEGLRRIMEKHLQPDVSRMLAAIQADILAFARDGVRDDMALMLIQAAPARRE